MAIQSPPTDQQLQALAGELGEHLRARGWRMATAESSTGGLIGHVVTMTPGASDYYIGGCIAYSNLAKEIELHVDHALIAEHGAVSAEVAVAMAEGARHRFGVELAVSVTGIAGPEGGSEGKPRGLHFVASSLRGHPPRVEERVFPHDRDGNRAAAARLALDLAMAEVTGADVAAVTQGE